MESVRIIHHILSFLRSWITKKNIPNDIKGNKKRVILRPQQHTASSACVLLSISPASKLVQKPPTRDSDDKYSTHEAQQQNTVGFFKRCESRAEGGGGFKRCELPTLTLRAPLLLPRLRTHTHTHTHTWAAISLKHSDRYWQPASLRVWSFQIIFMCDFKDQRRGGCEVLPRRKPKSSHLSLMNLRATPGRSPVIAVSQPLGRERSVYSSVQQFGPVSGFLLCALFSQTSSQIHGVQEQNKTAPPFFKTNICVMGSSQGHGLWHLWLCLQGAARLLVSGSREDNLNQTLGYSVQDDRWKKNNLVNVFTCLKL